MPKFTCIEPILYDRRYEIGSEITLPDDVAAPLLAMGHVAAVLAASVRAAGTRKAKAAQPPAAGDQADPGHEG